MRPGHVRQEACSVADPIHDDSETIATVSVIIPSDSEETTEGSRVLMFLAATTRDTATGTTPTPSRPARDPAGHACLGMVSSTAWPARCPPRVRSPTQRTRSPDIRYLDTARHGASGASWYTHCVCIWIH